MNEKEYRKQIEKAVDSAKEIVAKNNGFEEGILGTSWNYAMKLTHRKKTQIDLYEAVLSFMAQVIIDLKNKK